MSTQNSQVNLIELLSPVDGYTRWYVVGLAGTFGASTIEIRIQNSN